MKFPLGSVVPRFTMFGIENETSSFALMLVPFFGVTKTVSTQELRLHVNVVASDRFPLHVGVDGIEIKSGIVTRIMSPVCKGDKAIVSGNLKVKR